MRPRRVRPPVGLSVRPSVTRFLEFAVVTMDDEARVRAVVTRGDEGVGTHRTFGDQTCFTLSRPACHECIVTLIALETSFLRN